MRSREVVARNVRALRTRLGMSQEALAHVTGLDRTYISSLERCRYAVTVDVLDRVAEALCVRPVELLTPEHHTG